MLIYEFELIAMLVVILIASEVFTNALEHLGSKLRISEGVTGSVFAAVGTALPETMVPLLAIFAGTANIQVNEEVGVGAILGAPLMLSTLTTSLMAFAILRQRGLAGHVCPEPSGFLRDIHFFIVAFLLAAVAMVVPHDSRVTRGALSATLVAVYCLYIFLTVRASKQLVIDGHSTEAEGRMFLNRLGLAETMPTILLQLMLGLVLLVVGAKGFIHAIEGASALLGVSALLLSLLIIPIATELPEKVNSILWIRRGKDTLAFGNITGAMVFQGTLLPALGIMLTPWEPRVEVLSGIAVTLAASLWLRAAVRSQGLRVWALLVNGAMYAGYIAFAVTR
jgi:cation:H+ antiporter